MASKAVRDRAARKKAAAKGSEGPIRRRRKVSATRKPRRPPGPDLVIVYRRIEALQPYAQNARVHERAQVDQIIASVLDVGWTNPLLIAERGEVIAGHGRILAALDLRLDYDELPCIEKLGLTAMQKEVYRTADNAIPLNAGWDAARLHVQAVRVESAGHDVTLLGFSPRELKLILATPVGDGGKGNTAAKQPDKVAKRCKPGQLWTLGQHQLLCGHAPEDCDVILARWEQFTGNTAKLSKSKR